MAFKITLNKFTDFNPKISINLGTIYVPIVLPKYNNEIVLNIILIVILLL